MEDSNIHDVIIIGSGPAGYTAAIYAARANLNPLLFTGKDIGGQLLTTSEVDNFPGFPEGVLGPDLMAKMEDQAKKFGTTILRETIDKVNFSQSPFEVSSSKGTYKAKTIIVSTGASAMWLGLESEKKFFGKGVSACATCDGFFFKNKSVVVVGGGDTAMEEATFLTKFADSVTVIHRRDSLRASKYMQTKAFNNPKIKFIWDSIVIDVLGDKKVEGVKIRNLKSNTETMMEVQGLFVAIGHKPNTDIFKEYLELDEKGYIKTKDDVFTNIPGVYVAGDARDHIYRQAITAAADGCKAAMQAEKFLE